jgi:hypothetical protein
MGIYGKAGKRKYSMRINILDAHDRLEYFKKQDFDIGACCQNLIDQRPFGDYPFYIFSHARTLGMDERFKLFASGHYASFEEVPEKTIIWQPRLTKPYAQENSMLFKAYPGSDNIKIIWIIPAQEMWEQYLKGNLTENETVCNSIHDFQHNRKELEAKEMDDLPDNKINDIYREISLMARKPKFEVL